MKLEIFVVKTTIEALKPEYRRNNAELRLENAKRALIKLFGGCTTIKDTEGEWINKTDCLEADKVEIWTFYAPSSYLSKLEALEDFLCLIRSITKQKSQAYALNNEIAYI